MQTRGRNRLVVEQDEDEDVKPYIEHLMDGQNYSRAQPYIEQLMDSQNYSDAQARDGQSNELNSSDGGTEIQHDEDSEEVLYPKTWRSVGLKVTRKEMKRLQVRVKGSYRMMLDNLAGEIFQNKKKLRKSFEDHHSSRLVI
ncbi:uncharacterized protein [Nicotiana tomentosiformis]